MITLDHAGKLDIGPAEHGNNMKTNLITEAARLQKLAGILKEDGEQDKLDDLSAAFESDSVENYVNLLKKYQTDPKCPRKGRSEFAGIIKDVHKFNF